MRRRGRQKWEMKMWNDIDFTILNVSTKMFPFFHSHRFELSRKKRKKSHWDELKEQKKVIKFVFHIDFFLTDFMTLSFVCSADEIYSVPSRGLLIDAIAHTKLESPTSSFNLRMKTANQLAHKYFHFSLYLGKIGNKNDTYNCSCSQWVIYDIALSCVPATSTIIVSLARGEHK